MKRLKVLNLYAGLGGNRKYWKNCDVTAVEYDRKIASVYASYFPDDKVVVGDAHIYLLNNYKNFDFIWSSPPCPTHSDIRRCGVHRGIFDAVYPSMDLYQEIILFRNFVPVQVKWVVENVKGYYSPLISPTKTIERHYFWSNFKVSNYESNDKRRHLSIKAKSNVYGFNLKGFDIDDKVKCLRNMVNPGVGNHFYKRAFEIINKSKSKQGGLFNEI